MAAPLTDTGATVRHTTVKICGITTSELAIAAASLGAEMIGVVFASSRRQVSEEAAKSIRSALNRHKQETGERPLLVGVFVNESPRRMLQIAAQVGLDVLQLSGDESPEDTARCAESYPVLKAFRFPPVLGTEQALDLLEGYAMEGARFGVRPLMDAYRSGEYGGTGQLADWTVATALAARYEIVLAGGLAPANVAEAITSVRPWGVDVSSGVELEGKKDPQSMKNFVAAVRECASMDAATAPGKVKANR